MKNDADEEKKQLYYDQPFKRMMANGVFTSNILGGFIEELEGKDPEFIVSCLDLTDEKMIRMRNSESSSVKNGAIYRDVIFDLTVPGEGDIKVIVNLEAQIDPRPKYPLEARAAYYASRALSDQKDEIGDRYGKLCKVYSIWIVMQPLADFRNTVCRYKMEGLYDPDYMGTQPIPPCDYMEIVMIGLGAPGEKGCTALGLLNTVFSKGLDLDERRRRVEEDYKIKVGQSFYKDMEAMTTNLDEELEAYYRKLGAEDRDRKWLDGSMNLISKVMEACSVSFEEALIMSGFDDETSQLLREEAKKRTSY
ncbi:MAG: hypothetical protein J6W72_04515 [Candidatus Methanomethylophilaceae archaeon]|nr:hypothetical protein [Candidatus Methanomethylophilaceae archaeon]